MELPRVLLALAGTGAAAGLALLPYVPRVPQQALAGKVTATTFALDKPFCVFDGHADATDGVWLVVAFANATAAFRNPTSPAAIPPYQRLCAARSYMTLETPAASYACPRRSAAVLRVGGEAAACGAGGGPASCNGPLSSPGPYRVKFLALGSRGPKAETHWSEPIVLRQARSPSSLEPGPARRGSAAVVIASVLAGLGAALAVGLLGAAGNVGGGEAAGGSPAEVERGPCPRRLHTGPGRRRNAPAAPAPGDGARRGRPDQHRLRAVPHRAGAGRQDHRLHLRPGAAALRLRGSSAQRPGDLAGGRPRCGRRRLQRQRGAGHGPAGFPDLPQHHGLRHAQHHRRQLPLRPSARGRHRAARRERNRLPQRPGQAQLQRPLAGARALPGEVRHLGCVRTPGRDVLVQAHHPENSSASRQPARDGRRAQHRHDRAHLHPHHPLRRAAGLPGGPAGRLVLGLVRQQQPLQQARRGDGEALQHPPRLRPAGRPALSPGCRRRRPRPPAPALPGAPRFAAAIPAPGAGPALSAPAGLRVLSPPRTALVSPAAAAAGARRGCTGAPCRERGCVSKEGSAVRPPRARRGDGSEAGPEERGQRRRRRRPARAGGGEPRGLERERAERRPRAFPRALRLKCAGCLATRRPAASPPPAAGGGKPARAGPLPPRRPRPPRRRSSPAPARLPRGKKLQSRGKRRGARPAPRCFPAARPCGPEAK